MPAEPIPFYCRTLGGSSTATTCIVYTLNQLAFANINNILESAYMSLKISHIAYIVYLKRKNLSDAICHFRTSTLPRNVNGKG